MLDTIVLVLLWVTVVLRTPSLARGPVHRMVWLTFLTLALAKTVVLPQVVGFINHVSARPDLITLIHHLLGVVGAVAVLRFVALVGNPAAARSTAPSRFSVSGVVVTLVLTLLFFLSGRQGIKLNVEDLLAAPRPAPSATLYWLVLEGYLGAALGVATMLFWRVSQKSTATLLRAGLRIIALGTLLNTGYALVKIAYILARTAGREPPTRAAAGVLDLVLTLVGTLIVIGGALPASALVWRLIGAYRTLAALTALWRPMRRLFPDIVLPYPGQSQWRTLLNHAEIQLLLYRRIIEIRDGMLQLSRFIPAGAADGAATFLLEAGVPEADRSALVEACRIQLGICRMQAGQPAGGAGSLNSGGAGIADETRWLSLVGRALTRSPHPARFVRVWEREHVQPAVG